ncbi:hypothetical protein A6A04_15395 [Paramagnetospirillum marisnigri]|uniref:Uncharacterized protein n=1 Tax=Paramagnetospirillum marisnigri TaxID=1285242 RepID=A0A178MT83_9PROT|nr:hypothetical protein [Paramagnetospirillum marisnigri]OAN52884.1 hypothetical protein A6A04_15395 [Paramagnetospirillum marisnigri]
MAREPNCLPRRVQHVLSLINQGEMVAVGEHIEDSIHCPHREACELALACERIHRAFLPLVPSVPG